MGWWGVGNPLPPPQFKKYLWLGKGKKPLPGAFHIFLFHNPNAAHWQNKCLKDSVVFVLGFVDQLLSDAGPYGLFAVPQWLMQVG